MNNLLPPQLSLRRQVDVSQYDPIYTMWKQNNYEISGVLSQQRYRDVIDMFLTTRIDGYTMDLLSDTNREDLKRLRKMIKKVTNWVQKIRDRKSKKLGKILADRKQLGVSMDIITSYLDDYTQRTYAVNKILESKSMPQEMIDIMVDYT